MDGVTWFKTIGLVLLGQVLQHTPALSDVAKQVRRCLLAIIISGVLCAAFLLLCCFGFYRLLVSEGMSIDTAIVLTAGLMLVLALISALLAERYAYRIKRSKQKLSSSFASAFHPPFDADSLYHAFMEGWCKAEQQTKEHRD